MKKHLLLPFLASLLLCLSFHPANQGWIIWLALIPLVFYIRLETNYKRLVFISWASGFLFFFTGLWWLRYVTFAGLVILGVILGLYFVVFAVASKIIQKKLGDSAYYLTIPFWWVFLEFARAYVLTGFPWLFLGHTQYNWLIFIQICDITGVYGISFLIASVNSFLTFVLVRAIERKAPKQETKTLTAVWASVIAVLILSSLIYGSLRMKSIEVETGPKISLVQGNIPQSLKIAPDSAERIYNKHIELTKKAKAENPDLIVWAETMYPGLVTESAGELDNLKTLAKEFQSEMLIGAVADRSKLSERFELYNSAYYLSATGEILGSYDKIHLVPVSELLPFRTIMPWLEDLALYFSGLEQLPMLNPGTKLEPFVLNGSRFGVLICYESVFPELSRQVTRKGARFIMNLSNDGWFWDSAELEQILAISAFRAVENRIGFVRATNTGISAFISPIGRMDIFTDEKGKAKEIEGVFTRNVEVANIGTVYSRWGDWFPALCAVVFALIISSKIVEINLTRKPIIS
ncbi:MAG: apolipoprotein N-acyltransferase [Planctomycetes bacterium]|nr:apolipoprotein N-acyltransferase [Planctomycetota bacterium]